VLNILLY